MRYPQPWGVTDIDASYINGNPATGVAGSIPPSEAIEPRLRELIALIGGAGLTPDANDLQQVLKATRGQRINYASDVGAVNALKAVFDPPFTSLSIGLPLRMKIVATNTGPSTIQVDGLPPVSIRRANGAALSANDIQAGEVVDLVFDGTVFQIENFLGFSSDVVNNNTYIIDIPYVADSSVTPNVVTAVFNPAITSLAAGDIIEVKIANANTGPTTITVNALPSKQVRGLDSEPLVSGQLTVGMMAMLIYDGQYFQLCNPASLRAVASPVEIVKRATYQDPNYHVTTIKTSVEAFRYTYAPVEAGSEVRVRVTGTLNSGSASGPKEQRKEATSWLQYSTDGGTTWNPPSFPGLHYPSVGSFTSHPCHICVDLGYHDVSDELDMQYMLVGYLTVPAGPPASIIFRVLFFPGSQTSNAMINGGSVLEVIELAGLS